MNIILILVKAYSYWAPPKRYHLLKYGSFRIKLDEQPKEKHYVLCCYLVFKCGVILLVAGSRTHSLDLLKETDNIQISKDRIKMIFIPKL